MRNLEGFPIVSQYGGILPWTSVSASGGEVLHFTESSILAHKQ